MTMQENIASDWESRSDNESKLDPWTLWLTNQDYHFNRAPRTIYYADIPITLFVIFSLTQIIKNL